MSNIFNLTVSKNNLDLPVKSWLFPSGEVGIAVDDYKKYWIDDPNKPHRIVAKIRNSNDIIALAMLVDAIRREDIKYHNRKIELFLARVPFAQQDRICNRGESLSIKVFADLINSLNFDLVTVVDPHNESAVLNAFNNMHVISQFDLLSQHTKFIKRFQEANNPILLSPDDGSRKKTERLAQFFGQSTIAKANKERNLLTGEIVKIDIDLNDFAGRDVFIADDIALGGKTFIELAKILRIRNAGKIVLFVTHGFFSKGVDVLFEFGISQQHLG